MGKVEGSEEEDIVEEGGCLDDGLLGCRVGCSPGNIVHGGDLSQRGTCFFLRKCARLSTFLKCFLRLSLMRGGWTL